MNKLEKIAIVVSVIVLLYLSISFFDVQVCKFFGQCPGGWNVFELLIRRF